MPAVTLQIWRWDQGTQGHGHLGSWGWGVGVPCPTATSAPPYAAGTRRWYARVGATSPAASTFLGVEFIKHREETQPVSSGTESIRHLKEDKARKLCDVCFSNVFSRYLSPQARETKPRVNNITVSY